ncbi:MAG: cell division protein FtsA [Fimbriimonadaceae bacterium]|nr:cell division protein FtsA [Fimbriimonadaceae bacterium]QYK55276.1 MAG: cell division protein FtsA [Fimbriimonadaceae bacterium]
MSSNSVFAVDLGSTKAVCISAALNAQGEVRIDAVADVSCQVTDKGVVSDQEAAGRAIDEVVARVERTLGKPVDMLAVTLNGAHLQSVNGQGFLPIFPPGRAVRRDDVLNVVNHSRQVVLPPDREQVMALPREFTVGTHRGVAKPIGMTGDRLAVVTHLVTARTAAIQALDKAVTVAGRQVAQMVADPIASALGSLQGDEAGRGVVVVDIGGETTGITVLKNGSAAYSAVVPVGGVHVTSDLAHLLKVGLDEAERLKVAHASAIAAEVPANEAVYVTQKDSDEARPMQRRVLCEIVESRLREIASLVRRHLERSGCHDGLEAGLVLTGGGAQIPLAPQLFADVLGVGSGRLGVPKVLGPMARSIETPAMSAVVGLARYCLEGEEHELAPVSGIASWKDKIRTIRALFGK